MASINDELKKAILALPTKEKDKLLVRQIAKNKLLIDQLTFQLIEENFTLDSRRHDIREAIDQYFSKQIHYSALLNEQLGKFFTEINWHVKVTKDKYGEVELPIYAIYLAITECPRLFQFLDRHVDKLKIRICKKMATVLKKFEALDEDLKLDFVTKINEILNFLQRAAPYSASNAGLPREVEV